MKTKTPINISLYARKHVHTQISIPMPSLFAVREVT